MEKIIYSVVLFLATIMNASSEENCPRVTVKEGTMKGSMEDSFDGSKYYSFKGIPYAEPPIGELRFRDPQPPKSWDDELDATEHGPVCMQFDILTDRKIKGSENCLFLNVYTKSLDSTSKYPVMVFIHGGSFMAGSGNSFAYGPEFLLQHGVVVVTLNYRLEVLGFLSLDTPEVPGNAGIKDQVAALRWIKNNIAEFGGNPDDVTIFGESAGSASVTYHLFSAMSKGLFHKAIAQSGISIAVWANGRSDLKRAFRVSRVLGKETESKEELLQYLQNVPAENLTGMTYKTTYNDEEKYTELPIFFHPIVEQPFEDVEPFINEDTLETLVAGKINEVPIMIGYTSGEGIIYAKAQDRMAPKNCDTKYLVSNQIRHKISEKQTKELGDRIKKFYGNEKFSNETLESFVDFVTDKNIFYDTFRFAYYYAATKQPVYLYRFNFDTDLNVIKIRINVKHMKGAAHSEDLCYLFYCQSIKELYKSQDKLKEITYNLTKLWTNFAKSGNPTPDDSLGVTWEPLQWDKLDMIMHLEEPMSFGPNPDMKRLKFWNDLYCEIGDPCIKF